MWKAKEESVTQEDLNQSSQPEHNGYTRRGAVMVFAGLVSAVTAGMVALTPDADAGDNKKKKRRKRRRRRNRCASCCPDGNPTNAQVRVVHASPDAPNVDVYVDNTLAISNLPFGQATALLPVPGGTRNIKVRPAGANAPVVIDANVTLTNCAAYEISATGFLASIQAQVYEIDRSKTGNSTARVRAIHNAPDAPPVKVFVAGSTTPLFDTFAFPNATAFAEVPAGTYDLEIRVASNNNLVRAIPGVALTGKTIFDIFAIGSAATPPQGGAFSVLPLTADECCN
jgi:hypothetical protein